MNGDSGTGLIVLVTDSRGGECRTVEDLRGRTEYRVRRISVDALGSVLDERCPDGIVLALDDPETVREQGELINGRTIDVPVVVAPSAGGEALAIAALRIRAAEYVRSTADRRVDRIVEAIEADSHADRVRDDEFRRILATELPDEAFVIGEDGTYLEARVRPESEDLYEMDAADLVGMELEGVFPNDTAETLQDCIDTAIRTDEIQSVEYDAQTNDDWLRFEARVVPIDGWIDGQRAVVWLAREITERVKRELELRARQAELETLNRINAIVRQVIETLVDAPSRNAIERDVCRQLVDSELYCGSWIAEWTGDGQLRYRTGAGEATAYLEYVRERTPDGNRPFRRAARTGEIQTENYGVERESVPEPLRDAVREDDVRGVVAVPITHEGTDFGVLTVLASRDDAFSESERAGFRLLGETIGFTIMAVKNRQLLFADTVVELEFRIDGGDTFSFDLSREYDCTCSLEWAGTTANGRAFQFVTIDGLDGETVITEAADHDSVEECRLVHDGTTGCTIEIRLCESGVRTLTNHGVTIRDVTVEDDVGTCLIEVPQNANVREVADALSAVYENTELAARREVDREVQTAAERRNRILDELTDRQLTTLRLAYYGGFFDWPRESTGEEVAEAMDVSPPTMHQHLRKGLKTILGEFFEAGAGTVD
ncbi:bacterio-opsin activator domain-containing protein [Natrarchaeobius chitinivorans]|uniref:PAS domain S-box protein n=1 Tax=Natrarchaeobius chitinivorans TaxID=1679083 RepID=A0A3N6LU90_NATCH|nr:bacterio-opsin activator domain-containing protein [Natrarchaeobius chitinivorans]RQG93793.1 PAS domain S-box protein [Natrarchaeobius chitinivorans]